MNQSLPLLTPLRDIAALMVVLFRPACCSFPSGWSRSPAHPTHRERLPGSISSLF